MVNPIKTLFVTDIPYDEIKKGSSVEGINGVRGIITQTGLSDDDERIGIGVNAIWILWDDDSPGSRQYPYEVLKKVKYIG